MPKPVNSSKFRSQPSAGLPRPDVAIQTAHLYAGQRLAVAVSGGADSVALLLALLERRDALGLVLSVIHIHHGIRGPEADRDQAFVEALAQTRGLQIFSRRVDTPVNAAARHETMEEAARHLRYAAFEALLQAKTVDAIATAHTLNDQAETVLQKFLRGAWTEGLGAISPVLNLAAGPVIRPLLNATREEVEQFLRARDQGWCEDDTNRDLAHTRNRVRHHLLPLLQQYNPQILQQLSRVAAIARDEEAWWQREVARVGRSLLLPGKPVRGGGRSSSTHPEDRSVAFELERLRLLEPAMRRRVLRWATTEIGLALDFDQTERLMQLCSPDVSSAVPRRVDLTAAFTAQRTLRELQIHRMASSESSRSAMELKLPVPGVVRIEASGLLFETVCFEGTVDDASKIPAATIRHVQAGDRITLRHTSAPKKVKEVFERLRIPAGERELRLLVAWQGRILWLQGVELDPASLPALPFRLQVSQIKSEL